MKIFFYLSSEVFPVFFPLDSGKAIIPPCPWGTSFDHCSFPSQSWQNAGRRPAVLLVSSLSSAMVSSPRRFLQTLMASSELSLGFFRFCLPLTVQSPWLVFRCPFFTLLCPSSSGVFLPAAGPLYSYDQAPSPQLFNGF